METLPLLLLEKCLQEEFTETQIVIYQMLQVESGMKQISIIPLVGEAVIESYIQMMGLFLLLTIIMEPSKKLYSEVKR